MQPDKEKLGVSFMDDDHICRLFFSNAAPKKMEHGGFKVNASTTLDVHTKHAHFILSKNPVCVVVRLGP